MKPKKKQLAAIERTLREARKRAEKIEKKARKRGKDGGRREKLLDTRKLGPPRDAVGTWLVEVVPLPGAPDGEAERFAAEARSQGVPIRRARSTVVYELAGTTERDATTLATKLLSDPLLERTIVVGPGADAHARGATLAETGERIATCTRKPGVMDPVALSTIAAARDLGVVLAGARIARRVYVDAAIPPETLVRVATRSLGNEVLDRITVGPAPLPPDPELKERAAKVVSVPLRDLGDEALVALSKKRTLALDLAEMKAIQEHARTLGREPTELELETIAQTWSEHCKHKTLTGPIELVETSASGKKTTTHVKNLLKETIFAATRDLALERCVSVFKDNAGVVRFDEKHGIAVKVETHNHPSAIEPYGGSGTGVGGVIRDILGTGLGARPIASVDVFCVGDLHAKDQDVPVGSLHPRKLLEGVVAGVRDYGNRMGIPTVAGSLISDPRYTGNPLVYCGTIGAIPLDKVEKAAKKGDRIIVVGGRTGRDGIHGATFSSDVLTSESERVSSGAVQIGNAIEEKKLADVLIQLRDRGVLDAVTDCGAGGLSSAIGEMAAEIGANVELERVPLKYPGLAPWEIWVSEAQERMVLAVPPEHCPAVIAAFASEDVEATDVGEFRADGKLVVSMNGVVQGDLDGHFLHEGLPRTSLAATFQEKAPSALVTKTKLTPALALRKILAHPSVCSREWIIRQYDHEVQGGSTFLKPLVGANGRGPQDAVAVAFQPGSARGVLVGLGCQPRLSNEDPYLSAWASVDEAIRNVVASGGDPDRCAILDNFSWGDCRRDPEQLGGIVRAARACREAALAHRIPFISGKDSLNNTYLTATGEKVSIPGTLLVTCIAVYDDVSQLVSMDLKRTRDRLFLVGETRDERASSYWSLVTDSEGGIAPAPARGAPSLYRKFHKAVKEGVVRAAHDLSEGGLAVALAEMAFAGNVGVEVDLAKVGTLDDDALLFSESSGRILVAVSGANDRSFLSALEGEPVVEIGHTTKEPRLVVKGRTSSIDESLSSLEETWRKTLFSLYESPA